MENKQETRHTLEAISKRLRDLIRQHRAGKPVMAEMAERIRQRAEKEEKEKADSLIRDAQA